MYMEDLSQYVTSPQLSARDGIVSSEKELSDALTLDLLDHEIPELFKIVLQVNARYYYRHFDTIEQGVKILEEMEREMQQELAERMQILCRIDASPMLMGNQPILEVLGRLPSHDIAKHGFDHEQKEWEVKRASSRNEDYLGQKENPNSKKAKHG
jgi:hypothetical protein